MNAVPSSVRSWLFSPASHARRLEKTRAVSTDAVIVDLEDAVAASEKVGARSAAAAYVREARGERKAYIRINDLSTIWAFGDLESACVAGLDGIVIPKVESARDLFIADYLIANYERERGLAPGSIDLMPILETAAGAENASEIARAAPRVRRLAFGGGDFTNDTGTAWTLDNPLTAHVRAQIAIASRAAGLDPPIDTVWPALDDEAGLQAECMTARAMGYQGKMAIHPNQLTAINAAFSPSATEVASAERIVAAFDAAERAGSSALVLEGRFIDYPVVHRARSVLASAARRREIAPG